VYLKLPAIVGGGESAQFDVQTSDVVIVLGDLSRGHIEEYFERYTKAEQYYKKRLLWQFKVSKTLLTFTKNKMNNLTRHQKTLLQYKNSASGGKKYLER
jgi:hypothetical protein